MQWTTANPRIGPVPNINRAIPAIRVVTLESRMVDHAWPKPFAIADWGLLLPLNSSRIRSLINTFESIAMPSASAMAAIPGKVSVTCISDSMAISSRTFTDKAMTLKKPKTI